MNTNQIIDFFKWLWTMNEVKVIVTSTAINLVVAIAAALRTGEFKPYKIAEFLYKKLAPYVLVYGAVKAIAMDTPQSWIAGIAFTMIEIALATDLAENLIKLGIPMPDAIWRLVSKTSHFPADPAV